MDNIKGIIKKYKGKPAPEGAGASVAPQPVVLSENDKKVLKNNLKLELNNFVETQIQPKLVELQSQYDTLMGEYQKLIDSSVSLEIIYENFPIGFKKDETNYGGIRSVSIPILKFTKSSEKIHKDNYIDLFVQKITIFVQKITSIPTIVDNPDNKKRIKYIIYDMSALNRTINRIILSRHYARLSYAFIAENYE